MTGSPRCQPILETPSPEELQAWADEAQACLDSGEVFVSDHRKAQATVTALRSHAALVKALEKIADLVESEDGEPLDDAIKIANDALASHRSAKP